MSVPMDELAVNVLNTLKKSAVSSETKLAQLNSLKSSIKHQRIPENAQSATIECVRLAIASQTSPSLVAAGFSALTHLVKRLALQEQLGQLFSQRQNLSGALLERLGDAKETHRAAASQALCDIWPGKQLEVEKLMRDGALVSGNARAKLAAMQWVTKMHEEQDLQFRSFVPLMVGLLEDADGTVRESAKSNLVELFRGARDGAKADLKKQLLIHNVRKSIATYILSQLGIPVGTDSLSSSSAQTSHRPELLQHDRGLGDGAVHEPTPPPSVEVSEIEPLYVYTVRELDDHLRVMHSAFEDRESEGNWKARDNNVLKLRRLLRGNAPTDHLAFFVTGIKGLLDGILKVVNSLRTTLSTNGCQFIQELARTLGPAIDSMAEVILQSLDKMTSATKHIAAQNANLTVDTVLSHVSYNVRHMQHIYASTGDKNVQPRSFACGWLQTVLKRAVHHKSHFEHSGGLELADKSIRRGLADSNPKVRESMRATYWVFAGSWPDKAEAILSSLDAKSKQLLEQHQDNPNAFQSSLAFTRSVGPDSSNNPRLAASSSRASLKEHIAAQKKAAQAAKRMPDRPNSAMSSFTPVREAPSSARRGAANLTVTSHSRGPSASSSSQTSSRQPSSSSHTQSTGQGSLMSAPMRRPRRPEPPRPATADPYANRKIATPPTSPKAQVPGSHTKSKSTTTTFGTSAQSSRGASPRASPIKAKHRNVQGMEANPAPPKFGRAVGGLASPSNRDETFTTVVPDERNLHITPPSSHVPEAEPDRPGSVHSSTFGAAEEDNFTLVIPEKSQIYGPKVVAATQGPESLASRSEERHDEPVTVYEDPGAQDMHPELLQRPTKDVLEELPASEQNLQTQLLPEDTTDIHTLPAEDQERPVSPKKSTAAVSSEEAVMQDRAEVLKSRRLLASGIERIQAGTLDAHGFRRLQDLVKSTAHSPDIGFTDLLSALLNYLSAPNESLKIPASKAQALKSQALSAARALLSLHRKDDAVVEMLPAALCAFVEATKNCESTASHSFLELDKAMDELVKRIASDPLLTANCIDCIAALAEAESERRRSLESKATMQARARQIASALAVLSTLASLQHTGTGPYSDDTDQRKTGATDEETRQRLVRLAVKCLGHIDPDVRRKAMEFAVELYGCFPDSQGPPTPSRASLASADGDGGSKARLRQIVQGKAEFWTLMRAAGEQQCNLVAYYLARKGKGM